MSVHADPPPAIVLEPHGTQYATANQLGKGGFAICFKAERLENNKPTGHLVALKIVKTRMEPQKLAQKVCMPARRGRGRVQLIFDSSLQNYRSTPN